MEMEGLLADLAALSLEPDVTIEDLAPLHAALAAVKAKAAQRRNPDALTLPDDQEMRDVDCSLAADTTDTSQPHSGNVALNNMVANAYLDPNRPRLYGMPTSGVAMLKPPFEEYIWSTVVMHKQPRPKLDTLYPAQPMEPPRGQYYPMAPIYELIESNAYRCGWAYRADYKTSDRPTLDELMKHIVIPPKTRPSGYDPVRKTFEFEPVPGMIQVTLGIPYVHRINSVAEHTLTVFCGHTLDSLKQLGDVGFEVEVLADKLRLLTWGTETTPALFELPGLKTNLRSKNNSADLRPGDGSFNLASTHGEGEGLGIFLPAAQTAEPEAAHQIHQVLQILHDMYRLIVPYCISNFEWEMLEFLGMDNNVMALGGLAPGPPSCQSNFSSIINHLSSDMELSESIGAQGKLHEDEKDDPAGFTLVTVILKLAPGSDPGLFLCGRPGLYIHALGVWTFWMLFKGKDPHTGQAPTADPGEQSAYISWAQANAAWKSAAPQNRAAYVKYPSNSGDTRYTNQSIAPPLHFGNAGFILPHQETRKTFAMHGRGLLGDAHAYSNRLGRESFFLLKNVLAHCRLSLKYNTNELLRNTVYTDEKGGSHTLDEIPFDIDDDESWAQICMDYVLPHSKTDFLEVQRAMFAAQAAESQPRIAIPTEHRVLLPGRSSANSRPPARVVEEVLSRRQRGNQALWTVRFQGCDTPEEVIEANWFQNSIHVKLFQDYISKFGQGPREVPEPSSGANTSSSETTDSVPLFEPTSLSFGPAGNLLQGTTSLQTITATFDDRAVNVELARVDQLAALASNSDIAPIPDKSSISSESSVVENAAANIDKPANSSALKSRPKRKKVVYSSDEEEEDGSEDSEEDTPVEKEVDVEFEVESILDSRVQDGERQWLVHWIGYNASEDQWLDKCQLQKNRNARQMVAEYNKKHSIKQVTWPRSLPRGRNNTVTQSMRMSRQLDALTLADKPVVPVKSEELVENFSLSFWTMLLSRMNLEQGKAVLEKAADFRQSKDSPSSVANRIVDQIQQNNDLSSRLFFQLLPKADDPDPVSLWTADMAHLTLGRIAALGRAIPHMTIQMQIYDIMTRAIQAEICRSLIGVYQWIVYIDPSLADHLLELRLGDQGGSGALSVAFPQFAPLVEHILLFVENAQSKRLKDAASKPKKRARKKTKTVDTVPETLEGPAIPAGSPDTDSPSTALNKIPADLFGLLPGRKGTITIPPIPGKYKMQQGKDGLQTVSATWFCLILDEHLALREMDKVDHYLNPDERKKGNLTAIRNRCIIWGSILQCVADVFGDGIFASQAIKKFLLRPSKIFNKPDERLAFSIEKDECDTLKVQDNWLIAHLVAHPEVETWAIKLGELVHRGLLEIHLGRQLTDEEIENPHAVPDPMSPMNTLAAVAPQKKGKQRKRHDLPDIIPKLQTLLPRPLKLGVAAIIMREALAQHREETAREQAQENKQAYQPTYTGGQLRWLLEGQHPNTGDPLNRDPDQMDPIRGDLKGLKLLKSKIPIATWTSGTGISSLLVYMGTGQGNMTKDFLASVQSMHFNSLHACIEAFRSAEILNQTMGTNTCIANNRIYGQPSNFLGLHPTVQLGKRGESETLYQLSLEEKFGPYWEDKVHRSWDAFLGPMANQNPTDYTGDRPTWEDILSFIYELKLIGFGSGLTPLQFANNMLLAGIGDVESATPEAVATWIYNNKSYGAFEGLKCLGFALPLNASAAAVRSAFLCFYHWLQIHLTSEDKIILRFNAMFVEQLLCKITRWKKRAKAMAKVDLERLADTDFQHARTSWQKGANVSQPHKFPIPPCKDPKIFEEILSNGLDWLQQDQDQVHRTGRHLWIIRKFLGTTMSDSKKTGLLFSRKPRHRRPKGFDIEAFQRDKKLQKRLQPFPIGQDALSRETSTVAQDYNFGDERELHCKIGSRHSGGPRGPDCIWASEEVKVTSEIQERAESEGVDDGPRMRCIFWRELLKEFKAIGSRRASGITAWILWRERLRYYPPEII
ncbi:hypothetical protein C8R43DRAFT_941460 [Mycena crocata]|nr:hypothetical protein C8R43DRAFT_941460 [Mycena crocata]